MSKLALFVLVIVLQACAIMADSDDDPGVLERAKEAYRELKSRVVNAGSVVADFAEMYYDEHVKPVADPYIQWAKEKAGSLWERVKKRVSSSASD
ncbi:apolipoprotein C-IV [Colossoma macropomum]|uniref:apolipoprotein C-IV n=1 Tax=Colossoma macropomum TaxID=42526 RepID=UPI001864CC3F|nr:apolipoprotein C-IV [Colossoma macropomum]XP_036449153.1 apolipoprotein C-IV [Colossoma macropomum]